MIFAGTLTETLDFYEVIETQSGSGYKHTEEKFLFETKAYRLKNKEKYTVDADELYHSVQLTFLLRSRKEVKETNIVVYEGQRYRITSLDKYPRDREMKIILAKINE